MRGRPKLFNDPRQVVTSVEAEWYRHLSGEMLEEYRKQHPGARMTDLIRSIVEDAITEHIAGESERDRQEAVRRREMRRLAAACASADDNKLEMNVRKLAALVG